MTQEQILSEVANSDWQPEFKFTDDLDAVVDSILKPHEDYFLGLHSKVKEIIQREIAYHKLDWEKITFGKVCNWQKELFEYKKEKIKLSKLTLQEAPEFALKANNLPNQHINLGLRITNVKVGNWTPPAPMFLEDLKEMCFPIFIDNNSITMGVNPDNLTCFHLTSSDKLEKYTVKDLLTEWYKTFQTIHFFEDLNGRLGGIVINILSYLLTGKYLIKNEK